MRKNDVYTDKFGSFVRILSIGDKIEYLLNGKKYKRLKRTFEKDFEVVDMDILRQDKIYANDIHGCRVHDDFGSYGISFRCPVCGVEMVFTFDNREFECNCRKWIIDIDCIGLKNGNNDIYPNNVS